MAETASETLSSALPDLKTAADAVATSALHAVKDETKRASARSELDEWRASLEKLLDGTMKQEQLVTTVRPTRSSLSCVRMTRSMQASCSCVMRVRHS